MIICSNKKRTRGSIMFIDEIFELDKILNYEEQVVTNRNAKITNISYWNTSEKYQNYMLNYIKLEYITDIFNYKYTYDISVDIRNQIIRKLTGQTQKDIMCLLSSSSTCSITNMINFLKLNGFQKLCILTPSYFSVEQNCKIFHLSFEKKSLIFHEGKYSIPLEYILSNNFDSVWITSPIYSTSKVLDESQIEIMKMLMNKKILVIADETLALPGQELSRIMPINDYFYSIYSPHKPLFINNIKFSVILCPLKNDDFFEQWIDVLGGGLLHSNVSAILHFLSSNYQLCLQRCIEWYSKGISIIESILKKFPNAYCDTSDIGAYKTIYLRSPLHNFYDIENIKNLIDTQYVSFIPGIFNGFSEDDGNCFRVNLSLDSLEIQNALYRILNYYD